MATVVHTWHSPPRPAGASMLVTVSDDRPVFATKKRSPDADQVVVEWPHRLLEPQEVDERTVIAVLTHDPKFDVPALHVALATKTGYISVPRVHAKPMRIVLRACGGRGDSRAMCADPFANRFGYRRPNPGGNCDQYVC